MTKLALGNYPAPVTPFTQKGDFMPDAFAEIIRWHCANGAKGFLVAADNGEHWSLSLKEIAAITEIAMRETKGRLPVYVGAWAISEREAIARAEAAANAGAYGLCVKPQYYVHTWAAATKADIVGRFEAVGKAVPLPMMVYNSPGRTGVSITQEHLHAICDVVQAEALKDSNYSPQHQVQNCLQFHDRLCILISNSLFYFQGLLLGAGGTMACELEVIGQDVGQVFRFQSLTADERRQLLRTMVDVSAVLHDCGTVPAAYKAALNMIGLPAGYTREPLRPLTPDMEAKVRDLLVRHVALESRRALQAAS